MDLKLKGLRALLTGSSRGLGFAAARLLAMEGVDLVINARNPENLQAAAQKLVDETGARVIPLPGDLVDPAFSYELVGEAATRLGGLDLLFCNAGGPPSGKFEMLADEAWQTAVELTLMSNVRLIRAALPYLRQSKAASVLTVSSIAVKQPIPYLVLSNSIRLASIGLTKSLALELGSDGIRFNAILPAWTVTERVMDLMVARAEFNHTTAEVEAAKQAGESPFGRMGQPEEFANAAVFLLSPAASYITGLMLTVDGGMYKATI